MLLNKSVKLLVMVTLLALISVNMLAWSVSDYYLGNHIAGIGARNIAMGHTGVYDIYSPLSINTNPANVVMLQHMYGLAVGGLFTRNEDNRSFPLYNSFDAFIDEATYSSNVNLFDNYGFAGFGKYSNKYYTAGIGIHYLPVMNFEGKYIEEVRNNRNSDNDGYPEIIAMNEINNKGLINAVGFTLGGGYEIDVNKNVYFGVTVNSLNGESDMNKSIKWSNWAMQQSINNANLRRNVLPDSIYSNKSDISGIQLKLGTAFRLNSRWGIGLAYTPKTEFDRDSKIHILYGPDTTLVIPSTSVNIQPTIIDSVITDKYIMPSRLRVGFNYQPRNVMRTSFNAEIEYTAWQNVSKFFRDSWDIAIGVEHAVLYRLPLRLGFNSVTEWQAYPNYKLLDDNGKPTLETTKVITPSITAGSSVSIRDNLVLDIGLSFSWREYEALDMFRDRYYNDKQYSGLTSYLVWPNSYITPTDRGWDNPDKVRESFTKLSTSLTYTW